MGPIERELRRRVGWPYEDRHSREWLSFEAFSVLWDAEKSLGLSGPLRFHGTTDLAQQQLLAMWPDIWSEAIEAAEALGL